MNVLAIGAHPDDFEIGCYATLARHHIDGDRVFGVIVTKGENGGDVQVRMKEAEESAKVIGIKLFFGDFPDGDVKESSKLVTFLDNIVKENKIQIIYTHSMNDRHQDHRAVSRASMSVSRNVQEVYCYEAVSLISSFTPQIFVDVTETFAYKISALRKYQSQIERTFIDGLEGIARFRASQTRLSGRLCEAFEAYKILVSESSPRRLEILELQEQVERYKDLLNAVEKNEGVMTSEILERKGLELPEVTIPTKTKKNKTIKALGKNLQWDSKQEKKIKIQQRELSELKATLMIYREEMSMLKKEVATFKEALMLKKELALYKEALARATGRK